MQNNPEARQSQLEEFGEFHIFRAWNEIVDSGWELNLTPDKTHRSPKGHEEINWYLAGIFILSFHSAGGFQTHYQQRKVMNSLH